MQPTEEQEQRWFVTWLRVKGLKHWRTPNETYTTSYRQKAKNKALGVQAGIPDLFVIVGDRLIAVEMKRRKGGSLTTTQKHWLQDLNDVGVEARMCRGFEEAKAFVEEVQRLYVGAAA